MAIEPVFSGAILNHLIGEADACRRAANRLRVEPTAIVERHGLTAHAIKGNEQTADQLDLLRAIAELMNADPNFAEFVRVQLDPRTAVLHQAVNQIQDISLEITGEARPDNRFYREPDEVPSHLRPDSSSDLDAEDEYLAAGTGPLTGDARGTES